jgi:hypothetical protein
MSKTNDELAGEFLTEIKGAIDKHAKAYTTDAFWYQFIVILSAICGLLSLIIGTATNNAVLAGVFGGVTTIGSFLTQTLHCVKAQGWQDRMKAELDGIRIQFVFEHRSAPTPEALSVGGFCVVSGLPAADSASGSVITLP